MFDKLKRRLIKRPEPDTVMFSKPVPPNNQLPYEQGGIRRARVAIPSEPQSGRDDVDNLPNVRDLLLDPRPHVSPRPVPRPRPRMGAYQKLDLDPASPLWDKSAITKPGKGAPGAGRYALDAGASGSDQLTTVWVALMLYQEYDCTGAFVTQSFTILAARTSREDAIALTERYNNPNPIFLPAPALLGGVIDPEVSNWYITSAWAERVTLDLPVRVAGPGIANPIHGMDVTVGLTHPTEGFTVRTIKPLTDRELQRVTNFANAMQVTKTPRPDTPLIDELP